MGRTRTNPVEHFWMKVRFSNDCWEWRGARLSAGYGMFAVDSNKSIVKLAHRYAYEICVGEIPAGVDLDHRCHNEDLACRGGMSCPHRRCVRPEHLEVATRRENLLRSQWTPAAINARKAHCPQGHILTGSNLIPSALPRRSCRLCNSENGKMRYQARKQELLAN